MLLDNNTIANTSNRRVILIPDAEETLSDEDSEEEEDTVVAGMDVNHLGRGVLRQQAEIEYNDFRDNEPDVQKINEEGEVLQVIVDETNEEELEEMEEEMEEDVVPRTKKRRGLPAAAAVAQIPQLSRKKNKDRTWSRTPGAKFGEKIPIFQPVPPSSPVPDEATLPYDFLRLFITDGFLDKMVIRSKLYCVRRGAVEKMPFMTKDNILTSMAIMYMSGYMPVVQKEMWWQNRVDSQHPYIKKAMPRDTFRAVTSNTYFTTPEDQNPGDAFWKVRPLFDEINSTAKNLIQQTEYVSVDETMVRYFGPHPLKQAIREKPERYVCN